MTPKTSKSASKKAPENAPENDPPLTPPAGTAFGQQLRSLRLQKKITLASMAKILGVTPSYLSQIENGKKNISSHSMIDQINAVLGLIWDDAEKMKSLAAHSKARVTIDTTDLGPQATRAANLMAELIHKVDEQQAKLMADWLDAQLELNKNKKQ